MMASKILLVEDEPDIRKTLKYNFSRESFDVITAGSISEAESLSSNNQVDLIILDLMLPDGSGLDFCRAIKSDKEKKSIPVIILTAKADEVDRVVGFELGADDYVTKPFSVRELVLRAKAVMKRGVNSEEDSNKDFKTFKGNQPVKDSSPMTVTTLDSKIAPASTRFAFNSSLVANAFIASGESKSIKTTILLSSSLCGPAKMSLPPKASRASLFSKYISFHETNPLERSWVSITIIHLSSK